MIFDFRIRVKSAEHTPDHVRIRFRKESVTARVECAASGKFETHRPPAASSRTKLVKCKSTHTQKKPCVPPRRQPGWVDERGTTSHSRRRFGDCSSECQSRPAAKQVVNMASNPGLLLCSAHPSTLPRSTGANHPPPNPRAAQSATRKARDTTAARARRALRRRLRASAENRAPRATSRAR